MPAELPRLSGIATKDLVETIGSGNFKAQYINWSRTMELLRQHAPGWMVELVFNSEGDVLHRAPVGAQLLLRFRHLDGTVTPEVPQAVMDNRNNSIPFDKITSRDITDTHRRGSCLLAAYQFGLAYELWAKMPLESGYRVADDNQIQAAKQTAKTATAATKTTEKAPTEKDFLDACAKMGLSDAAAQSLLPRLKGDYAAGLKTLADKDEEFVKAMNAKFQAAPGEEF